MDERQSACLEISVALLIGMGSLCLGCGRLTLEAEVLNIAPELVDHTVPFLRHRPRRWVPKHEAGKCNDCMHQVGSQSLNFYCLMRDLLGLRNPWSSRLPGYSAVDMVQQGSIDA